MFHIKNLCDIFMFVKYCFLIVGQGGTKAHWVNTLQNFKHNYVNVFEKYLCITTVIAVIFRQRDTKAHCCQKK